MSPVEIIENYFQYINNQDWEKWLTLFDENIVVDEALTGHIEGLKAMQDSAKGIQQGFSKFENHIQEIVIQGNKGMVVCHIQAISKDGVPIESTGANFYIIKNEKIVYMSSFHDSTHFAKVLK